MKSQKPSWPSRRLRPAATVAWSKKNPGMPTVHFGVLDWPASILRGLDMVLS